MSYSALVKAFSKIEELPIPVDQVLDWIRRHTDHKDIRLHPVRRGHKAFRGAFRRVGIPKPGMYSADYDIVSQILYGEDLDPEWKRLVIVKEALHVFNPDGCRVTTPDLLRKLIPTVISADLRAPLFAPGVTDYLGVFRAMAVLLPKTARRKLKAALVAENRNASEIANFAHLPAYYVDLWLDVAEEVEPTLWSS